MRQTVAGRPCLGPGIDFQSLTSIAAVFHDTVNPYLHFAGKHALATVEPILPLAASHGVAAVIDASRLRRLQPLT